MYKRQVPHGVPRYFDGGENKREDGWLLWPVSVERGLDALLAALPRLRAAVEGRGGDFKLIVCHHEDGYHARGGSRRELPADVVFAGMLPPRELAALYRTCALFVFPSSVPEAFSLSSWECALHGVVPVAYSLGALEALAEHHEGDVEAVREASMPSVVSQTVGASAQPSTPISWAWPAGHTASGPRAAACVGL